MRPGATATLQPEISEVQLQDDTPLSSREMYKLSRHLVVTWDRLAALLGIAPDERHDIRYSLLYTQSHSKAEKMLAIFNNMQDFSRQKLAECLEKVGQSELNEPVLTGEWKAQSASLDVLPKELSSPLDRVIAVPRRNLFARALSWLSAPFRRGWRSAPWSNSNVAARNF